MSESRFPPVVSDGPAYPGQTASAVRLRHEVRWRDIEWVEFDRPAVEAAPVSAVLDRAIPDQNGKMPATSPPIFTNGQAFANNNEPLPAAERWAAPLAAIEAEPPPALSRVRAPRYGRDIAPLPPHLIASVPAPPRERTRPAMVKLRAPGRALGKRVAWGGPVLPDRFGGGGLRRLRLVAVPLVIVGAALFVYCGGDILAGLTKPPAAASPSAGSPPATNTRAAVAPGVVAGAIVAPASPAPPPAEPAPAIATAPRADIAAPGREAAERAAHLLSRAKAGDVTAQYNLAMLYARGDGLAQDYASAASWFREAAISGNTAAQFNLGVLYERGLGLSANISEALIWYHSAAARQYPPAQYNLALTYADGRGTPRDLIAAGRWYRRAAEQGLVAAMVNFAIQCEKGEGVERSPITAYAWYRAAATRGDEAAAKHAADLARLFSDDDRKRAEALATTVAASIRTAPSDPSTRSAEVRSP